MRLSIEHSSVYRYSWPVLYSIQQVRLTPRQENTQQLGKWSLQATGSHAKSVDHFGNTVYTVSLNTPHRELMIALRGEVELKGLTDGRLALEPGELDPMFFLKATALTASNDHIEQFALPVLASAKSFEEKLMALSMQVSQHLTYTKKVTDVTTTAVEVFDKRQGVCQDFAHLMIACLRAHHIPARYVGGYFYKSGATDFDSHAWLDAYDEANGQWVSIDPTHQCLVTDKHCRVAVALDYTGAAPVRGVRSSGGEEELKFSLKLKQIAD